LKEKQMQIGSQRFLNLLLFSLFFWDMIELCVERVHRVVTVSAFFFSIVWCCASGERP
jgi:hypothetical protein